MKKFLFLVFVITAMTAGPMAYAQFSWILWADLNYKLVSQSVPTGERAEKLIEIDGDKKPNISANNPSANTGNSVAGNRGVYSYTAGTLDAFNYGRAASTSFRVNELRLDMDLRINAVEFHTRAMFDPLFRSTYTANQGTGANEMDSGHSLVQGNGKTPNWADFFRYMLEQWYIRGNFNSLTFYVGNIDGLGKVRMLSDNITDDVLRDGMYNNYGVRTPADNNANINQQSVNNFLRNMNTVQGGLYGSSDVPYLMITARIDKFSFPITFQIAADPGDNNFNTAINYKKFNGALRISGEKIANKITFDAIYKFKGGDPNITDTYDPDDNPYGVLQPNGDGISAHSFGLYAEILGIQSFAFGLGYSGYFKVFEDSFNKTTKKTTTMSGPLFSGIDLRFVYTGIQKTAITFNSNISFANTGKSYDYDISAGVWGRALPAGYGQSWFSVCNSMAYSYAINNQLRFLFQLAHRYGIVATEVPVSGSSDSMIKISDSRLASGGLVLFRFNSNLSLSGGFAFIWINNAYSNNDDGAQKIAATRDTEGGIFEYSFPIRLRFVIRP